MDAEGYNQTVDRLADCAPPLTETLEISRGLDSQLLTTEAIQWEVVKPGVAGTPSMRRAQSLKPNGFHWQRDARGFSAPGKPARTRRRTRCRHRLAGRRRPGSRVQANGA